MEPAQAPRVPYFNAVHITMHRIEIRYIELCPDGDLPYRPICHPDRRGAE